MGPNTEVSLDALHQAIIDAIQAKFPDLATVEFYREDRKGLQLPACLLELTEWENAPNDDDPQTEQLAVDARFEAHLILGFRTPEVKLAIRKLAASFGAFLRFKRWPGVSCGAAQVIGAYKDDFSPELDEYECWKVEWVQRITLGETVWKNDGTVPIAVFIGFTPEVGVPHVDKYVQVAP